MTLNRSGRTCGHDSQIRSLRCDQATLRDVTAEPIESHVQIPIVKIDPDQRLFGGWAYVAITKDGAPVEDHSGDLVDTDDAWQMLKDAFVKYALESRAGDDMHQEFGVAQLVEMFISDEERWQQIGIPEGTLPKGVFLSFKADDSEEGDRLWDRVKAGHLKSLSIVGRGYREVIDA